MPCQVCTAGDFEVFLTNSSFEVRRCVGCGLHFLHPQPTSDEVQAYYNHDYFSNPDSPSRGYDSYLAEADNHRATFRKRLRMMAVPRDGERLLDVGAAAGFFVEQARLAGWCAEGVEPSSWAVEYATKELGQPVTHGTLESAKFPASSFDVITMWEVIEHLTNPRASLEEAARVLRSGGHLILSTPDAGSLVARLLGTRWPGWAKIPEHLFFFDRRNLTRLLLESGFVVEQWRYVSITVPLGFAARRLATLTAIPLLGKLPRAIARVPVAVNPLYDLMLIARRA
jgi:SAM-dependent methyltransferase